jgi:hypothetical protein
MAVYAPELTREALWEAMWARRVYATTGERILVDLRADGKMMGGELKSDMPPGVVAQVAGTAPLHQVELIRNGQVVKTQGTSDLDLELSWRDTNLERCYYYLRVTQADGEMAWSSPIWVNPGR